MAPAASKSRAQLYGSIQVDRERQYKTEVKQRAKCRSKSRATTEQTQRTFTTSLKDVNSISKSEIRNIPLKELREIIAKRVASKNEFEYTTARPKTSIIREIENQLHEIEREDSQKYTKASDKKKSICASKAFSSKQRMESFEERNAGWVRKRTEAIKKHKKEAESKEMAYCTFRPVITFSLRHNKAEPKTVAIVEEPLPTKQVHSF